MREKGDSGEHFFRLRGLLNVRRVVRVRTEDKPEMLGILRYERLPVFYYGCGVMGHTTISCSKKYDSTNSKYGFWLITDFIPFNIIWDSTITGVSSDGPLEPRRDNTEDGVGHHEAIPKVNKIQAASSIQTDTVQYMRLEETCAARTLQFGGNESQNPGNIQNLGLGAQITFSAETHLNVDRGSQPCLVHGHFDPGNNGNGAPIDKTEPSCILDMSNSTSCSIADATNQIGTQAQQEQDPALLVHHTPTSQLETSLSPQEWFQAVVEA